MSIYIYKLHIHTHIYIEICMSSIRFLPRLSNPKSAGLKSWGCSSSCMRIHQHNCGGYIPTYRLHPSDGVFTRRHTAECAFCIVFYSVFCFSTMLPWGGEGGAGTTVSSNDVFCLCPFARVLTVFFALSHSCFFAPSAFSLGFYSVFRLHDVADATPRWGGGDVNVPCNLLTLLMLRHAGVGGDVNVPCNLLTLLMLRHAGVGDANVPCNLLTLLMLRHAGVGGC